MSQSMIAKMRVMLSGNVASEARKTGQNFETMATRGTRAMSRLKRGASALDRGIGRMTGRVTALAGGIVGVQAVRNAMSAEKRWEFLGIAANKTTEEMMAAKEAIAETANLDNIKVDPTEILAAIEAIQEKTGDFDLAFGLRAEIGKAISATGSAGDEIGRLTASIAEKFDIKTPEGMKQALDLLAKQGKGGAVELKNLADLGPKVFAVYGSFGKSGLKGLAEAGALMQIFQRGVGSAQNAATVFENVFNTLGDATKIGKLKKLGVAVEDETGKMKKPVELLKTIVEAAGGDDMKIGAVFDAESLRGMRQLSKLYRETGGFGDLDQFIKLKADGSTLEADAARIAATTDSAYQSALGQVATKSQELLADPMKQLAAALQGLDKETMSDIVEVGKGLTAALIAYKGVKIGVGTYKALRPVASAVGGASGLVSLAKPTPVFVTNPGFGKGFGSAAGQAAKTTGAAATGAAATSSTLGTAAAFAGRVALPVAALTILGGGFKSTLDDNPRKDQSVRAKAIEAARETRLQREADRSAIARRLAAETRPSSPARDEAIRTMSVRADIDPLTTPLGERSSAVQSPDDDRMLDAMLDIAEESRETRELLQELTRTQPLEPYAQSQPGNTFRITGAP